MNLSDLHLIKPRIHFDERGYFFENFRTTNMDLSFVQENISFSYKNTLRGLHFQQYPGQAKLVQCLMGKIFDVVVDIRPNMSTFGHWKAFELDGNTHAQLFIPVGFAHGFCVLSETALIQYKVSSFYNPKEERAIRWNDPKLNIQWPISNPILSEKDQKSPFLNEWLHVLDCRL